MNKFNCNVADVIEHIEFWFNLSPLWYRLIQDMLSWLCQAKSKIKVAESLALRKKNNCSLPEFSSLTAKP